MTDIRPTTLFSRNSLNTGIAEISGEVFLIQEGKRIASFPKGTGTNEIILWLMEERKRLQENLATIERLCAHGHGCICVECEDSRGEKKP